MFNYILYRIGQFIALSLPLKVGYAIAIFVSDLRYIFARQDRICVFNNLRAIFPDKPYKQLRRIRRNMFRNFAKYLVDFFRFSKLDKNYIRNNVLIENKHYFDQALSLNKGMIILTAHLGNWELGGVIMALSGYPFWAVALEHKYKRVNDFFNSQRESKGITVIPFRRAVRQCLNVLKEKKILALVGDRDFTGRGVEVNFFGKPAMLPEGPAAFSLKTGAVIVPAFMVRNDDDTFTLRIEEPLETPLEYNKENLIDLTNRYKVIFERYVSKYPDQWYMFKNFWNPD